jgi:GNAT superfamily N-acetyltransferase
MDTAEVLALYDHQMRHSAVADPGARIDRADGVVRQYGPAAWTGILWSDLDETTADAAIGAQIQFFEGGEFEWKLYAHDRPADLGERLHRAGFVPEESEALMVAAVSELPADAPLPDGVSVQPVVDEHGVDLMVTAHERAFGADGTRLRQRLISQLERAPESTEMLVAMAGETPVCGARMDLHPGTDFASLWGGGTVPEWRGKGIYKALVAVRTRSAAARGIRYLQVDASDDSRPILQRLGFVQLDTTTPYNYVPR